MDPFPCARQCGLFSDLLFLLHGIAGETYSELLEDLLVNIAQHHSGVNLAACKFGQFLERAAAVLVLLAQQRQGHENLVGVQTRVAALEVACLGMLYRLDERLRYKLNRVVYARKMLHRVEYQRRARAQKGAGFGGDDCAVGKLYGRAWHTAALGTLAGGSHGLAVVQTYLGLLEEESYLVDLAVVAVALGEVVEGGEVAAYDLHF